MNEDLPLFHPVNEPQPQEEPRQYGYITQHIQKHYKKHLFGLGILSGIALFQIITTLGSYMGITTIAETTSAGYMQSTIESALATFDQMEVIARQKDAYFHQEGKIYSYTGEVIFHRLDTMFHILDNAYRASFDVDEKFRIAERLDVVFNQQNELFLATQDINPDRDAAFKALADTFHTLQKQLETE